MKISVIICEFNPLHYGHKRLIDFAKTISDKVVCVMSGNFVQRGMPAVANKYKRARHAVLAGSDLVVELPCSYATASAQDFALGGVQIANALGADFLVFGSECGKIAPLAHCAEMLNSVDVNEKIRLELQRGVTYPKAVSNALGTDVLDKPNNTLAVEYLRALKTTASKITPVTIAREDNFNSAPQQYASSTALRENAELREKFTFDFVQKDIDDTIEQKYGEFSTRFLATAEKDYLENVAGVSEGLHNRIFDADKTHGFEKMMSEIKTKRYTRASLNRIVLHAVLGIMKEQDTSVTSKKVSLHAEKISLNGEKIKVLAVNSGETQLLANPVLSTDTTFDELTARADRLYATLDGETPPIKLLKI